MASHGVTRTTRSRTEEQKKQELEKINKYRDLEEQIRTHIAEGDEYTPEAFQLTTKLLRLNPEYYTIWNVRRRLLISGLLSKRPPGFLPSKALPSSSRTGTITASSADSSSSSSTTTQQSPRSQTTGKSGTTADATGEKDGSGGAATAEEEQQQQTDTRAKAQQDDLDVLKSELGFTVPLLMEFPKCYWIWKYRSWLLQQAIDRLDRSVARRIWEEELGLDTKMLSKDRRNFHAWGYRRNVVKHLESSALNGKSMVEAEFEFTARMIRVDLSNFSAWHSRSKLIPRLLAERGSDAAARRKFFDDELALIREALNVGPDDQSLWYYHQFLMLDLVQHIDQPAITVSLTNEDRAAYITREIEDAKDLLEDYDDCKLIYERLMDYTLALAALEQRPPRDDEQSDLRTWLSKVRDLDPMKKGRWDDLERKMGLSM